jgi:hypothetical protein
MHTPGVLDTNVTGKNDDAVALRVTVGPPKGMSLNAPKLIVCGAGVTEKLCVTDAAGE